LWCLRVQAVAVSPIPNLEMVDGKSGAVVASREDRCEICSEAEALETANTAASTDVLAISGSRNDVQGFALALELWNASSDESAKSQGWCNFCTGPQMVTAAQDLGRPLLTQLATKAGATPAVVAPGASVPSAPNGSDEGISKGRVLLGTGVFAVGAAAIVVGVITWHRDGEITDCMVNGGNQVCTGQYGGKGAGISLVVGGALAAVAGGWLFASGLTSHGAQVAIGPHSVAIAGSF